MVQLQPPAWLYEFQGHNAEWSDWSDCVSATIEEVRETDPPVTSVDIIFPENDEFLCTDFTLALSATPASGKIVKQETVVPRILISPEKSFAITVELQVGLLRLSRQ